MRPQGFYRRVDDLAGIEKAPGDVVDYSLDWVDHLAAGVTISSATWVVSATLTEGASGVSGSVATKRISGGTAGTEHKVTCQMTKSNGERIDRTFVISVVAELS